MVITTANIWSGQVLSHGQIRSVLDLDGATSDFEKAVYAPEQIHKNACVWFSGDARVRHAVWAFRGQDVYRRGFSLVTPR